MKIRIIALLTASALSAHAQSTASVYTGKITVAGQPFNGTGTFKFALVDQTGNTVWTNSDNIAPIETGEPSQPVRLAVNNGVYVARLGAPGTGMLPIPANLASQLSSLRLSIWFDDGTHGTERIGFTYPLSGTAPAPTPQPTPPRPAAPDTNAQLLAELRQLRSEVASLKTAQNKPAPKPQAPPKPVFVTLDLAPETVSIGSDDAPLVLVEYSEYQCPFCSRFHDGAYPDIVKNYIETGKLRFVPRNFPLAFHDKAEPAAHAALCAWEQGKFEEMRKTLFANMPAFEPAKLKSYAEKIGLDLAKFETCLGNKTHAPLIESAKKEAAAAGITGTPSFVLGRLVDGKLTGERIVGAQPFATFQSKIDALLKAE